MIQLDERLSETINKLQGVQTPPKMPQLSTPKSSSKFSNSFSSSFSNSPANVVAKQSRQRADAAAAKVKELQSHIADIETFHLQAAHEVAKKGSVAAACHESPSGKSASISIKMSPIRSARSAPARTARASNIAATGSPFSICFCIAFLVQSVKL